jgi:diguanylate cyclase (GGDEF)-like protein/PAS domain S-box-containing protein
LQTRYAWPQYFNLGNPFTSGTGLKTKAAFGAAFSLLLGVGIAAVFQTYEWEGSVARVTHTFEVLGSLNELSHQTRDFVVTRHALLQNPSPELARLARGQLRKTDRMLAEVERLGANSPAESSAVRAMQSLAGLRAHMLSDSIERGDLPALRETLRRYSAGITDEQITKIIRSMQTEERRLLDLRIATAHQIASFARRLFEVACLLSFLLIFLALWQTRAENSRRNKGEGELALREAHYRSVVESAGDLIFRTDPLGRFTFCNHTSLAALLLTEQEVIGRSYLKLIRVDKRRRTERFYMRQFIRQIPGTYCEFPIIDGHGRERWLGQSIQLIMEQGRVTGFQGIAREITERIRAESGLEKSRTFAERVAATTPGLLYVYDLEEQRNVYSNRETVSVLGREFERLKGMPEEATRIFHPDDLPAVRSHHQSLRYAQDREVRRLEYRARHANGHWVWLASRDTPFERGPGGRVKRIVGIAHDISERKAALEKMAQQANYDDLTGLANRQYFLIVVQRVLTRAAISGRVASLCTFSMNDFREAVQLYGHEAGDHVLKAIGEFLKAELRPIDISARLGVDEFAFLLPDTKGMDALRVAERLQSSLTSIRFGGTDVCLPFSIAATFGVAESKTDMQSRDLLEAADQALYRARESGSHVLYHDAAHQPARD